ncbi:MAG: acyl-CoA thioesterase [Actinobacteria bacterium]|nr:acyl-CoA thioesterase [Actinomycetota bacterium]
MMGASTTIRRRLEWIDTDAAGIWHYSTVIRYAEAAESALHRELGIVEFTFGALPRVHVEFDFVRPVLFDEVVCVTLTVDEVGDSSLTYHIELSVDGQQVTTGKVVVALIDRQTGQATAWPEDIRAKLAGTS